MYARKLCIKSQLINLHLYLPFYEVIEMHSGTDVAKMFGILKNNTLENSKNNDKTGLSIFDKIFDNTSDNIEVRSLGIMHLSSASLRGRH